MNPRTSLTTSAGLMIDLLDPKPEDIDFGVIAEHLAKVNRYCGATRSLAYNVADHSVRCADAGLAEGGPTLAAYLLLHDAHEAYLGDDTTPKKKALAAIIMSFGILAQHIEDAFRMLTWRLDRAIHARAGLDWPPPSDLAPLIHTYDRMLLSTEWRDLMRCGPPYDLGPALAEKINPLPWQASRTLFEKRCHRLLPCFAKVAA